MKSTYLWDYSRLKQTKEYETVKNTLRDDSFTLTELTKIQKESHFLNIFYLS
jgi:hypothetical protein